MQPRRRRHVSATSFARRAAGTVAVPAPMQGKIVSIDVKVGDVVRRGRHPSPCSKR